MRDYGGKPQALSRPSALRHKL